MSSDRTMTLSKGKGEEHRFDVYLRDIDNPEEGYTLLLDNVSCRDALRYITSLSGFRYKITRHGNENNVFLEGSAFRGMDEVDRGARYMTLRPE